MRTLFKVQQQPWAYLVPFPRHAIEKTRNFANQPLFNAPEEGIPLGIGNTAWNQKL